jgi:hypothetical protein
MLYVFVGNVGLHMACLLETWTFLLLFVLREALSDTETLLKLDHSFKTPRLFCGTNYIYFLLHSPYKKY